MASKTVFPSLGIACMIVVFASTAFAQNTESRVAASVAGGIASPFHSDFGFTAPEWQLAVRMRVAPHVSMEVFVDEWRHADNTLFTDVPLQGVSGFIGRVQEVRTRTAYTTRVIGWNTILHGGPGRLTIFGGGGPGYMTFDRRYTLTMNGCSATDRRACQSDESNHASDSFAGQVLGGAEVAITSRVAVFGQLQLAVPVRDPGSSHASTTGGVRVRLW